MKTLEDIEDIKLMVDTFYNKLAHDELLKPIFIDRLGEGDWQPHLERIYLFWEMVLLGGTGYLGNTFAPHASLKINEVHFKQWLFLFTQTMDELFEGPKAQLAKEKAILLSSIFESKMKFLNS